MTSGIAPIHQQKRSFAWRAHATGDPYAGDEALDPEGRLYMVETVLEDALSSGAMLDLIMLVLTGSLDRAQREFEKLLENGVVRRVEPSVSSVLIAEPYQAPPRVGVPLGPVQAWGIESMTDRAGFR